MSGWSQAGVRASYPGANKRHPVPKLRWRASRPMSMRWCGQNWHISSDCQAKHYSRAMQERFPKKKRTKKKKILEYTCRRCGDKHPFNRYCPYAIEPPIIPGECRSCATLTNHHDDRCELVELKDRIGMCAFCGDVSHMYAECPDRYPNRTPKRVMGRGEGR